MKKFIIIVAIIAIGYHFKPGFIPNLSFLFEGEGKGAFDEQGNPVTLVFVHDKCGSPCDDAIKLLKKRRIKFSLHGLDNNEENRALWKEYGGVNAFPNIVIGYNKVQGSYKSKIASALAQNYGDSALTRAERSYVKKHFYNNGEPKLVMYGASWCPYCTKIREELEERNIDLVDIDVEKSSRSKHMKKTLDISGYPLIYYGYKRLEGPTPKQVLALL